MATRARALWRALDNDTKYYTVGMALAVPTSIGAGVQTLAAVPHEVGLATMGALATGTLTIYAWPVVIPTAGVYALFSVLDRWMN